MTIYKGKNVDEAIEKGLAALNLKKNEVHINIIEKGQAGIFGFFEKEAEVDIIPLTEKELKLKKITPYLVGAALLLSFFIMLLLAIFQDNKPTTASPSSTSTTIVEKTTEKSSEQSSTNTENSSSSTSSSSNSIENSSTSSSSNSIENSSTSPSQSSTITVENNSEFQVLLQSEDQSTIEDFIKKYKGQTIEFDGNIAHLAKVKSKYDILIHSWDYHPDEATGPNFKFVEISLISNPIFKSFNGENIKVGQNVHIKAKVGGYNEKQDLVFLSPIEVSPR
ncbi:DUF4839 domain-containing protein [Streptococcus pseudopneumoniae]|uniref:DUF4839 domain-containing protein n=1 Tax=Streptococcus pseudopneumoniae TaxID=257758 RepID=UPI00066DD496|nr:DUF4839 domain-containing protein [Streptococcus pseudopneumoniae]